MGVVRSLRYWREAKKAEKLSREDIQQVQDERLRALIRHVKEKLAPPDRYNLELSFGICKLVLKMMAKAPNRRHASMNELLGDLRSIEFLLEVENPREQKSPMPDLNQHMEKVIPSRPKPAITKSKPETTPQPKFKKTSNLPLLIGLGVSVLLNIILLILWLVGN